MAFILGVTGVKNSGKSEVRKYLVNNYGFQAHAMADPIKEVLALLGMTEEELNGSRKEMPSEALMGMSYRHGATTLGTGWGRGMIHPDFWVFQWGRRVDKLTGSVVADDIRYLNEEAGVRQRQGRILRVVREGLVRGDHSSETEMVDIVPNYTISNNGTILDLRKSVDKAMAYFKTLK